MKYIYLNEYIWNENENIYFIFKYEVWNIYLNEYMKWKWKYIFHI